MSGLRSVAALMVALAPVLHAQSSTGRQPVAGAPVGVTAFVNVAVVPMDAERVLKDQTVLVEGGWITKVGPSAQVSVPKGATRIEGRGQYLIPGLGDMHMHLWEDGRDTVSLFLLLANGVTTARSMFGAPSLLDLRARAASGELLSPRFTTAGPPLNVESLPQARELLDAQLDHPYDAFKVYDRVSSEFFDTIVAASHRLGRPLVGHVPAAVGLERALQVPYSTIEHLGGYLRYLTNVTTRDTAAWRQALDQLDMTKVRAIAEATKRAGVWNTPTLVAWENMQMDDSAWASQPGAAYLPQTKSILDQAYWQAVRNETTRMGIDLAIRRRLIKPLHDAGAGLLLGTDGGSPAAIIGFSIHQELAALVTAGLTPYQALETGTRNIAVYSGTLDSTGTVAVGKRADLVLLQGNPLENIANTAEPAGVMIGGRWLSRQELDRRLALLRP